LQHIKKAKITPEKTVFFNIACPENSDFTWFEPLSQGMFEKQLPKLRKIN
jgi:hypothetical protein